MSADHKAHLEEVRKKHDDELAALRKTHVEETKKLAESHEERIAELHAKHAQDTEALRASHMKMLEEQDAQRKALEEALEREREAVRAARQEVDASKEKLRVVEEDFNKLRLSLQEIEATHAEEVGRLQQEMVKEREHTTVLHKNEIERLLETHLQETQELQEQFERAKTLQEEQIDMLQQSLQQLQALYDQRPSREEDLERLAALEADLREKEAAFKKMYEEMQFYKLELVNREQNYNKVFGSTPNVGVLNPNQKRGSSGGQPRTLPPQNSQSGLGLGVGGGMGVGGVGAPVAGGENRRKSSQGR